MKIDVIKIDKKNAYLVRGGTLGQYQRYFLNEKELSDSVKREDIVLLNTDKLQVQDNDKELYEYKKGDSVMTADEYREKPTYYDDNDSDEDVLRCIANKKELSGYEPQYREPKKEYVKLNIIGLIEDTGSQLIFCTINSSYRDNDVVIYTLDVQKIAMSEYIRLKNLYKTDAIFNNDGRYYLRFAQINGNYAFDDCYPFSDSNYKKTYLNLSDAQSEELNIRTLVKNRVDRVIFQKKLSDVKSISLTNQLSLIKRVSTRKGMIELIEIMIDDLAKYKGVIV